MRPIRFGILACLALSATSAARADFVAYDATGNSVTSRIFGGVGLRGTNDTTSMFLDDINVSTTFAGSQITNISGIFFNGNNHTVAPAFQFNFFAADGPGGAPGTILQGLGASMVLAPGADAFSFSFPPPSFVPPILIPANGRFYVGVYFQDASGNNPITAAELANLGMVTNNPTVGTSNAASGLFGEPQFANNPTLSSYAGTGGNPATFAYQFRVNAVVPEPSSLVLLGFGALGLLAASRHRGRRPA